jgi:hypothetical protein
VEVPRFRFVLQQTFPSCLFSFVKKAWSFLVVNVFSPLLIAVLKPSIIALSRAANVVAAYVGRFFVALARLLGRFFVGFGRVVVYLAKTVQVVVVAVFSAVKRIVTPIARAIRDAFVFVFNRGIVPLFGGIWKAIVFAVKRGFVPVVEAIWKFVVLLYTEIVVRIVKGVIEVVVFVHYQVVMRTVSATSNAAVWVYRNVVVAVAVAFAKSIVFLVKKIIAFVVFVYKNIIVRTVLGIFKAAVWMYENVLVPIVIALGRSIAFVARQVVFLVVFVYKNAIIPSARFVVLIGQTGFDEGKELLGLMRKLYTNFIGPSLYFVWYIVELVLKDPLFRLLRIIRFYILVPLLQLILDVVTQLWWQWIVHSPKMLFKLFGWGLIVSSALDSRWGVWVVTKNVVFFALGYRIVEANGRYTPGLYFRLGLYFLFEAIVLFPSPFLCSLSFAVFAFLSPIQLVWWRISATMFFFAHSVLFAIHAKSFFNYLVLSFFFFVFFLFGLKKKKKKS